MDVLAVDVCAGCYAETVMFRGGKESKVDPNKANKRQKEREKERERALRMNKRS